MNHKLELPKFEDPGLMMKEGQILLDLHTNRKFIRHNDEWVLTETDKKPNWYIVLIRRGE